MQALAVVPALNGPEEGRARRLPGVERAVAVQLGLEAAEEALHRGRPNSDAGGEVSGPLSGCLKCGEA